MVMIENFVSDTEKFTLDGISSDTLGLFCDYLPPMPMAEQQYTTFNTGADEAHTTPDDTYSDIKYVIRFYTFLCDDYNDMAVKEFCANKTVLTLSRFPEYYFKIRKISLQAVDGSGYGKRIDYSLVLTLAPFRYSTTNSWITLSAPGNSVVNLHTRYSKPIFEITGTGDITLSVQNSPFSVTGLTTGQTIIIDSDRHITYSGNAYLTCQTNGQYPLFNVGANVVSWTGTITTVKYKGNWRDY